MFEKQKLMSTMKKMEAGEPAVHIEKIGKPDIN